MTNDNVPSILISEIDKRKAAVLQLQPNTTMKGDWLGTLKPYEAGLWFDYAMLLVSLTQVKLPCSLWWGHYIK